MIDIKAKVANTTGATVDCKMEGNEFQLFRELLSINCSVLRSLFPDMTEGFAEVGAEGVKQCLVMELKHATSVQVDKKEG